MKTKLFLLWLSKRMKKNDCSYDEEGSPLMAWKREWGRGKVRGAEGHIRRGKLIEIDA
jgi:hypothetical protein